MRIGEVRHPERSQWGRPLAGVRVLAAEQMQALPYATQLLAHLGAEVVKIEPPGSGETGRASSPALVDDDGRRVGATYLRNNLGKRSITLDLKQPEGREIFLRLAARFDVVAENMRPGAMDRLGLGYETVSEAAPRCIYVSLSGFGHDPASPYVRWPAYAPIAEAMSGLYEPTRAEGQPPPTVIAGALGDIGTGLFACIGILAALRHREQTGLGQRLDLAMFDAMVGITDMIPFLWSMGAPLSLATSGHLGIAAGFAAKDGHFVVAVFRRHHFERLANTVGHPEWCDDPRFETREGWARHTDDVIRPALEAWARDRTKLEAAAALCEQGIAAGPSNRPEDVAGDEHVRARDMLIEVPRPDGGDPLLVAGNPIKLSRVAEGPVARFPALGADTEAVLRDELELDEAAVAALRERGVIGT